MASEKTTIDVEVQARVFALGNIELHNGDGDPVVVIGVTLQMNPDEVRKLAIEGVMFKPLLVRFRGEGE